MSRDPAARKYAVLSLLRLAGGVLVMVGILAVRERIGPSIEAGYVMLAMGLVSFFFIPQVLARRWRSTNSPKAVKARNAKAKRSGKPPKP